MIQQLQLHQQDYSEPSSGHDVIVNASSLHLLIGTLRNLNSLAVQAMRPQPVRLMIRFPVLIFECRREPD